MGEDIVSHAGGFLGTNDATVTDVSQDVVALEGELSNGERLQLIDALLKRRSVLPVGPYTQVASSVLAANSRASEAQLRAAMLRSQERELKWLPTLGPQISLNSLGSIVANLVIEQTLCDNGAKRAEREFARADVEVAAAALAQDTNDRVYHALDIYLTVQSAQARADLQLVQQRLTQMRSDVLEDREAASSARGELAAMSATSLDGVSGIETIGDPAGVAQPLDVMKVEAQGTRGMAEARALQAGYSPNIAAPFTVGQGGTAGINVGIPNGLGFGRSADLAAIAAMGQAAERDALALRYDLAPKN